MIESKVIMKAGRWLKGEKQDGGGVVGELKSLVW